MRRADECSLGLFCDLGDQGGVCRKRAAEGQPCSAASADAVRLACDDGMLCRGFSLSKGAVTRGNCAAADGLVCANGTCADEPVSGPCTSQDDCKEGVAYCDGAQCQLLKRNGAGCGSAVECESRFCNAGTCDDTPGACHEP